MVLDVCVLFDAVALGVAVAVGVGRVTGETGVVWTGVVAVADGQSGTVSVTPDGEAD